METVVCGKEKTESQIAKALPVKIPRAHERAKLGNNVEDLPKSAKLFKQGK